MHPGIFDVARGFHTSQVHVCQLCGFEAHNPSYFSAVDSCGIQSHMDMNNTDDFLVTQMSDKFGFLKSCTKEELALPKKEVHQLTEGWTPEDISQLCHQVNSTLDNFRNQAHRGQLTREYTDARDAMKICAGCCGLIHGTEYWQ